MKQDKITSDKLGMTDLGKEMLSQDYILKQLSSSLTHPDTPTGRAYWSIENRKYPRRAHSKIENRTGKIWIKPDKSVVYENGDVVYIKESTLKVTAEEESGLGQVLEEIEEEVNSGQNFAKLRQLYHSVLLAVWFKQRFQESIYKRYIDQGKIKGIDLADRSIKDKIWRLYCSSFEKGVYDLLRKDSSLENNQKRKYFSGGVFMNPTDKFFFGST